MSEKCIEKRQERLFLGSVLSICFILGFVTFLSGKGTESIAYKLLQGGFTFFPVLSALIIRRVTKSKASLHLSLKVWKHLRLWLFCSFGMGLLIAVGAVIYYLVLEDNYSGYFAYGILLGQGDTVGRSVTNPVTFISVCILLGAVFIPLQLFELGEEIGWRGYLLPLQVKTYGVKKAILKNGFYWGISHFPLIYFGFNYSLKEVGAPWTSMLMMLFICIVLGIIFSYVTLKSGNCMYAAICHGTANLCGEIPVALSISKQSGLLGPNPTGLIGMTGFIIAALMIWVMLGKGNFEKEIR